MIDKQQQFQISSDQTMQSSSQQSIKSKNPTKIIQLNKISNNQQNCGNQHRFLLKQIKRAMIQCPNNDHHMLPQIKYLSKMQLKIIQKKPLYVCDDEVCIIALMKQDINKKIQLNPFNKVYNQFYTPHSKPQVVFNCHDQALTDQVPQFPLPYHPSFHYKNYEQFKERKKIIKVSIPCQHIEVKCWSISIVNISGNGYYAPILLIHQFRRMHGNNKVIEEPVQNILFYSELRPFLQNYRINDMRKQPINTQNNYSFAYYMRNQVSGQKTTKTSLFVCLDIRNTYLANNSSLPTNFIFLGNIPEYSLFKKQVNTKYLSQQQEINLNRFTDCAQKQKSKQFSQISNQSCDLPFYQFQQEFIQHNQLIRDQQNDSNINQGSLQTNQCQLENQSQSDQNFQDYLRNAYMKKMNNNNQTII